MNKMKEAAFSHPLSLTLVGEKARFIGASLLVLDPLSLTFVGERARERGHLIASRAVASLPLVNAPLPSPLPARGARELAEAFVLARRTSL